MPYSPFAHVKIEDHQIILTVNITDKPVRLGKIRGESFGLA